METAPGNAASCEMARRMASARRAGEGAGVSAETSCHAADRALVMPRLATSADTLLSGPWKCCRVGPGSPGNSMPTLRGTSMAAGRSPAANLTTGSLSRCSGLRQSGPEHLDIRAIGEFEDPQARFGVKSRQEVEQGQAVVGRARVGLPGDVPRRAWRWPHLDRLLNETLGSGLRRGHHAGMIPVLVVVQVMDEGARPLRVGGAGPPRYLLVAREVGGHGVRPGPHLETRVRFVLFPGLHDQEPGCHQGVQVGCVDVLPDIG